MGEIPSKGKWILAAAVALGVCAGSYRWGYSDGLRWALDNQASRVTIPSDPSTSYVVPFNDVAAMAYAATGSPCVEMHDDWNKVACFEQYNQRVATLVANIKRESGLE